MMSSEGLERLDVWRKAKEFALAVYLKAIPLIPAEEKWGLGTQLRRSASSIPANIAEGYGRYYFQENIRYCYIARGSLEETISHLIFVRELGYFSDDVLFASLIDAGNDLTRLLNGYIAYLKRTRTGENEPGADRQIHDEPSIYQIADNEDIRAHTD